MSKKFKVTLQEAAKTGDLQTVTRLIRDGADPSQADEVRRYYQDLSLREQKCTFSYELCFS